MKVICGENNISVYNIDASEPMTANQLCIKLAKMGVPPYYIGGSISLDDGPPFVDPNKIIPQQSIVKFNPLNYTTSLSGMDNLGKWTCLLKRHMFHNKSLEFVTKSIPPDALYHQHEYNTLSVLSAKQVENRIKNIGNDLEDTTVLSIELKLYPKNLLFSVLIQFVKGNATLDLYELNKNCQFHSSVISGYDMLIDIMSHMLNAPIHSYDTNSQLNFDNGIFYPCGKVLMSSWAKQIGWDRWIKGKDVNLIYNLDFSNLSLMKKQGGKVELYRWDPLLGKGQKVHYASLSHPCNTLPINLSAIINLRGDTLTIYDILQIGENYIADIPPDEKKEYTELLLYTWNLEQQGINVVVWSEEDVFISDK